jgi:hypothetical protein
MKIRNLFLFVFLFGIQAAKAQSYTLAFANQPYQNLVNDTILSDTQWVANQYRIKLPFVIRAGNVSSSEIFVDSDGRILRRSGTSGFRTVIYGFGNCGLQQKSNDTSTISWVMEGTTPNRIAKVQFRNAGFVGDETNTDVLNFQIWMYESGKKNEIVFGPTTTIPMRALNGAYGPFMGIGSQYITGTPTVPVLSTVTYGMNGMPKTGYVYRFTRP